MRDWLGESEGLSRKALMACVAAVFWYVSVFGFWLIPWTGRLAAQSLLSSALSRQVAIDRIRFNPYTFWFGVYGLKVLEPDGDSVFCSFTAFEADIEPTRAFSGAISIKDILLDAPMLRLIRKSDGTFNLAEMTGGKSRQNPTSGDAGFVLALPRGLSLELANVRVRNGAAVFADEVRQSRHAIENLHFYLPYFSTEDLSRHAILESNSRVDESPLQAYLVANFNGEAPRVNFEISVSDVALTRFADFFPAFSGLDAQAKSLGLAVNATFGADGAPEATADLDVRGIRAALPGGEDFFSAASFGLEDISYDFHTGRVSIGRMAMRDYAINLNLSHDGGIKSPLPAAAAESTESTGRAKPRPSEETQTDASPGILTPAPDLPDLVLARLTLDDGVVRLTREGEDKPVVAIAQADVSGWGLNLREGAVDQIDFTVKSDLCAKAWLRVSGRMHPAEGQAYFAVDGCDMGRVAALTPKPASPYHLTGKTSFSGTAKFSLDKAEPRVALTKGHIQIAGLKVSGPGATEPALAMETLTLEEIEARYPERELSIAKAVLAGGGANLGLDAGGGVVVAGLAGPFGTAGAAQPGQASEKKPRLAGKLRVGEASVSHFTVAASGSALRLPVKAEIERLSVKGAAYPPTSPITAELKAGLGPLGSLETSIEIAQTLDAASGKLVTGSLSLPALAQFLPPLPVAIDGGAVTIDGTFACALPKTGGPDLRFAGDVKLASVPVAPPDGGDRSWIRSLSIVKLAAQTSPLSLAADSVELDGAVVRLDMSKEGVLSVAGYPLPLKPKSAPGSEAAAAPANPTAKSPLTLGRLKASGVKVEFIDHGFEPAFKANVALDLTLRDITPNKPLGLTLGVLVNGSGRIKAEGSLSPPGGALAFDMKAGVENLDLAEGSPYVRRFTGFPVATGKLNLAGEYKFSGHKLDLQNKIKAQHIQLGPKAPDATANIPLDLAVSLLGDASGNIELDIPVGGDLGGVKVDLGQAIGRAVSGAFGKVLLGPFAFLTVGGKTGQTMPLPFAPGSAVVEGEAAQRLADMAKALANNPKATLEITGYADQALEAEGIKRFAVRSRVAEAMGRSGQLLSESDYARLLGRYYTRATGGKKAGETAAMENELLLGFTLGAEDTRTLARCRAVSVREFLIAQGVSEANIFLVPPDNPTPKPIEGVAFSRAELTLKR
ncbi:MAG: DUF748 domain-containing protein [Desulfovibrionaceae bacterium]|nr:DUF748 domain-containing protein [Desulfovibrionaceae bacterium]